MCFAPDVALPLPHALGTGLPKSVTIFETVHSLFSGMSLFIRTEMSSNFQSVWRALSVSIRQSVEKTGKPRTVKSVALGWTEYYDLMNGKCASSFGFEMLCVSVGQINRKGYQDNEQGTGTLSECCRLSLLAAPRVGDFFMGYFNTINEPTRSGKQ
jgi:hypothetical protein